MFWRFKRIGKSKMAKILSAVVLAGVLVLSGITVSDRATLVSDSLMQVGVGQRVITIGSVVYAAGTVDYTTDGVDDNVQFQSALDALPANGGKISVLTGNYVFSTTVTRAIPNVTIDGNGLSTNFTYDGVNPIFTAGGNNWIFGNFVTDVGGVNLGATTGWVMENIRLGATYYVYRSETGQAVFNSANITSLMVPSGGQLQIGAPHISLYAIGNVGDAGSGFRLDDNNDNNLLRYIRSAGGAWGGEFVISQNISGAGPTYAPLLDFYQIGSFGEIALRWAHLADNLTLIPGSTWILGVLPDPSSTHRHFQFNQDGNYSAWLVDEDLKVVFGALSNPIAGSLAHQHPDARVEVRGYTDSVQLLAKGNSVQTSDIFQVTDNTSSKLFYVTNSSPTLGVNLNANGKVIDALGEIYGQVAYGALYINGSPFGSSGVGINFRTTGAGPAFGAINRLTIGADAAIVSATWSNITHSGIIFTAGSPPRFSDNSTGAQTSSLGGNNPATDNTTPYTWIQVLSGDGSTVYIPAWK